jgi:hypothetical protein
VQGYTLAQLELFSDVLDSEERRRARLALIVARGAKGKPESFRKMLRELG